MSQRGSIPVNGGTPKNGGTPHNGNSRQDTPQTGASPSQSTADSHPSGSPHSRRPKSQRADAFDFSAWLLEGLAGLSEELQHNDLGLPPEFWTHAYAARREALLAARALIDTALTRCGEDAPATEKPGPKRGRVDIDFG